MAQFLKFILWFKNYATSQAFLDKFQKENLQKQNLGQSVNPVVIILQKKYPISYLRQMTFLMGIAQLQNEIKSIFSAFKIELAAKQTKDLCLNQQINTFYQRYYPNVINTTIFNNNIQQFKKKVKKHYKAHGKPLTIQFSHLPQYYTPTPVLYYILPPNPIYPWYFKNPEEFMTSEGLRQTRNSIDVNDQQANDCLLEKSYQFSSVVDEKSRKYNEVKKQILNQDYILQLKDVKSRNILPNAINLILSFIRRINKSGRIAKKIIEKLGKGRYDVKKYYSYQAYLKDVITSYTSKNILHLVIDFCNPSCKIFSVDEQKFYNMVTRNLVLHFIKVEGPLALFTSKKEHKTRKIDHLKVYRFIIKDLQHYYRIQKELKNDFYGIFEDLYKDQDKKSSRKVSRISFCFSFIFQI